MNTSLYQLYLNLEERRQVLLNSIQGLSSQELGQHPEGKWSIAQVLSHIIASEQLSVNYLNKKILGIKEAPDTEFKEELKMIVVILSQRLPFLKLRAPKVVTEQTTSYHTIEQLNEAWMKTRTELKDVLARFNDNELKRKVYKHPYAGMLNIEQALVFFREHLIHHTPQIKNLLKKK